jgi:hypothetical protein
MQVLPLGFAPAGHLIQLLLYKISPAGQLHWFPIKTKGGVHLGTQLLSYPPYVKSFWQTQVV